MVKKPIESRFKKMRELQAMGEDINARKSYDKELRSLLKIADQRIIEIERVSEQVRYLKAAQEGDTKAATWVQRHHIPGIKKENGKFKGAEKFIEKYEGLDSFVLADVKFDLKNRFNSTRFNRKANYNNEGDKIALTAILEKFLTSELSTKTGISKYQKATNAFNDYAGTDFTWQEFAKFANSEEFNQMKTTTYSSDVLVKSVGKISKLGDDEREKMVKLIRAGSDKEFIKKSKQYKEALEKIKIAENVDDPDNKQLLKIIEKGDMRKLLKRL